MGLTVQYGIESRTRSDTKARALVEKMRQICMDLPFYEVGEIVELTGEQCNPEIYRGLNDDLLWLTIQSGAHVDIPWTKGHTSLTVNPTRIIAFTVLVGSGCEPMNIGLCQYPKEIEYEYKPEDDNRFYSDWEGKYGFDFRRWDRYVNRKKWVDDRYYYWSDCHKETRKVKTGCGSKWTWGSFCKTQYANDPRCGGLANFLRCHISVVTALERIDNLPTVNVSLDDEGDYGRNWSCPDWREADEEKRDRVYDWYEGHHDPKKLETEIGEWDMMIAAFTGAMNDAAGEQGVDGVSAMDGRPDFERLEHVGRLEADDKINQFLEHLGPLVKAVADKAEGVDDA